MSSRPWWEREAEEGGGAWVGSRRTGEPGRARVGGRVEPRGTARGGVGWAPGDRPWWETAISLVPSLVVCRVD